MSSSFELFKNQLDEAVGIIEQSKVLGNTNLSLPQTAASLVDTQSLLSRCEQVSKKHEKTKPTIRIVHHLACSGGTLISKCISAMPNVYLLSEVHPYTDLAIGNGKPKYAPSDISSLTKYAGIPKQRELAGKLFKQSVDQVYQHVAQHGGILVLRDHTHADFNTSDPIPEKSSLISLLEDDYDIKSILTLRDPIDSYASLVKNSWVHFEPKSFDEYCRRLTCLIEKFNSHKIFSYEKFLQDPKKQMQGIAASLDIPFDEKFEDIFSLFRVTGDSGRTSDVIGYRPREADESIIRESERSKYFENIKNMRLYS